MTQRPASSSSNRSSVSFNMPSAPREAEHVTAVEVGSCDEVIESEIEFAAELFCAALVLSGCGEPCQVAEDNGARDDACSIPGIVEQPRHIGRERAANGGNRRRRGARQSHCLVAIGAAGIRVYPLSGYGKCFQPGTSAPGWPRICLSNALAGRSVRSGLTQDGGGISFFDRRALRSRASDFSSNRKAIGRYSIGKD
jgi:hypothetical protein